MTENTATSSIFDFGQFSTLRSGAQQQSPEAIRKTAQQFEALMVQNMLKSMRATSFGDDLTGSMGDNYRDLYDQQLSQHLTSGRGIGLADMLVTQLQMSRGGAMPGAEAASAPSGPFRITRPDQASATTADGTDSADGIDALGGSGAASGAAATGDATSKSWRPRSPKEFIEALRPHAERAARALGVPARALVAQAALETGWGRHLPRDESGKPSFNLFGIKAQSGYSGDSVRHQTREFRDGEMRSEQADFRAYNSIGQSFDDYVKFLKKNPRYADALRDGNQGVQSYARGLQKAGYATDPGYANKIARVADSRHMREAWADRPRPASGQIMT